MADVILDLFGLPVVPRHEGRGRPEHQWTLENSNRVNILFASGHDVKAVAKALGITAPTLRKHYFAEVAARATARLRMFMRQAERLNAEAEKGNVAAEKALMGIVERERVQAVSDRIAARGASERKPAPLGKKAAAQEAACLVGGKFAPPAPPASLLN